MTDIIINLAALCAFAALCAVWITRPTTPRGPDDLGF